MIGRSMRRTTKLSSRQLLLAAVPLVSWISVSLWLNVSLTHNDRGRRHNSGSTRQSQRQGRTQLAKDFASVAAKKSIMCASKTETTQCTVQPCQTNSTIPQNDWHYGLGLVDRDNSIRSSTIMQVGGQANAGSGCVLSVKYKFIYIHVLKSAGMTIKAFLKKALCGGWKRGGSPCADDRDKLEIVDCARAVHDNPDYFVWSFVRNPFSRLYSGYSMADSFRADKRGKHNAVVSVLPEFSFDEFATATNRHRSKLTHLSISHLEPQTSFLFDQSGCPVFDFLGRLENLNDDLHQVLDLIGSPELKAFVRDNNGTIPHASNTAYGTKKAARELHGDLRNAYRNPDVVAAATREYARDFALLGYDPTVIPS